MSAFRCISKPPTNRGKSALNFAAACVLMVTVNNGFSAIHYVDLNNPNPTPPYTNWFTAATNIQDAVDAANAGDEVLVTNGIYANGGRAVGTDIIINRALVNKPVSVRSVNGPVFTIIDAATFYGVRCAYLGSGAKLAGFTLTNGAAGNGGGVWCDSKTEIVSNCIIGGNSADGYDVNGFGGGAYQGTLNNCTLVGNGGGWTFEGGGAYGSQLNDCTLIGNSAFSGGGAASSLLNNCILLTNFSRDPWADYPTSGGGVTWSTLNDCILIGNSAYGVGGEGGYASFGGGAFSSTLNNSTLTANSAAWGGGASDSTFNNCTITGNLAYNSGGGAFRSALFNCILTGNSAGWEGGGSSGGTLNNCTITGNSANLRGGVGPDFNKPCLLNNCIVYFNFAGVAESNCDTTSLLSHCCTTPPSANGIGNITNTPLFVNFANGNLRLQSNSPCINAGNNAFAPAGPDLDGNPRIVGGTVDIGAYEFESPSSRISYAWLQQFGMPTDGSVDFLDPDDDSMNNWQEWRAGTSPTNTLSVLRMNSAQPTGTNVIVNWQSVAGVSYTLERVSNLTVSPVFALVATNIVGQSGTTTYTDTSAAGVGRFFYRVGVRN